MSPFITYRDIDINGELQYYVLQREFPHFIGLVSTSPTKSFVPAIGITAHRLWIVFEGTLRGSVIPNYLNIDAEVKSVMNEMSQWYYANRISLYPKKYKKFKI